MIVRHRVVSGAVAALAVVALARAAFGQVQSTAAADPASSAPGPLFGPYTPPACTGVFADVACPGGFAVNWIEQFSNDGITAGCGGGNYCPDNPVTRAQMAVFVEKAMRGTANWPAHTQLVWAVKNPDGSPNPTGSGTALLNAAAAIPTAGTDAPSATNPWLLKVGPGIYDLGSGPLTVPIYTAIEGAGEEVTTVVAAGSASQTTGTIVLGQHSQARLLTVKNVGGAAFANGVALATSATGVRLSRLTIDASQPSNATTNQTYGVTAAANTQLLVSDVTISAHGGYNNCGLYAGASTQPSTFDHVAVTAADCNSAGVAQGVVLAGAPVAITNSTISASSGTYATALEVDAGAELTMQSSRLTTTSSSYQIGIFDHANVTQLQDVFVSSQGEGITLGSCGVATCSAEILNSRFATNSWAIDNGAGFSTLVAASRLAGNTVNTGGTLTCMGNYTTAAFYPTTCP